MTKPQSAKITEKLLAARDDPQAEEAAKAQPSGNRTGCPSQAHEVGRAGQAEPDHHRRR